MSKPVQSADPRRVAISPARSAAFAILERVATTAAHSDDLLHGPAMSELSQADRNLATALVLGVLRWQIALDAAMRPMLQRPDLALPPQVAIALRLGAFQMRHMDRIPAHAALSESVELVRAAGHGHAAGMVNAILRRWTREPAPKQKLYETPAVFAERLGHPAWIVERWARIYGRSSALAICTYDQQPPAQGGLFAPAEGSGGEAETQENQAALRSPQAMQMDDGSRLVAELAAAVQRSPERIWDCCAAPGGKTLVLAGRHSAASILATDSSARRLNAMAERMRAAAPAARTMVADAAHLPEEEGRFDLILCDVPCSGTGTLGRNPEIKLRLQPSDVSRQAARQREILAAALMRLNPGGALLYSTCSLEPEENEGVVAEVLRTLPKVSGIELTSLKPALQTLVQTGVLERAPEGLLRDGMLRTLSGANFAGDGFFAALFRRG